MSFFRLLPFWIALLLGSAATAQDIGTIQSVLRSEISFSKPDHVVMGPAEACPDWVGTDFGCRRYEVVYRGVFLSGVMIAGTERAKTIAVYLPGHESPQLDDVEFLADTPVSAVFPDAANFIGRLLADGADVLILFMPSRGLGPVEKRAADVRAFKRYSQHEAFALLDRPGDSAASYFVAHLKVFLDRSAKNYERVVVYGRSGGGWSATVAAAVDSRIDCSISFFGTLPMSLRMPREDLPADNPQNRVDLSDFEQFGLLLWKTLDYVDLYAMATVPLRTHAQIYNEQDECCFSGAAKGILVDDVFASRHPRVRGFSVRLLPVRSETDHMNLDDHAYNASQEICPVKN